MRKDEILFRNLAQEIINENIDKVRVLNDLIKPTELYKRNDVPLHKTSMALIKDAMCTVAKEGLNKDFFTQFVKELPSFWFKRYLKNMIEVLIETDKPEKYDQIKIYTDPETFYKNHNFLNASFCFYNNKDYARFHEMMISPYLDTKDNSTIRKAILRIACDKEFKENHFFVEDIFKKTDSSWIYGTCRNIISYMIVNQSQNVIDTFFYFNEYFGKNIVQKEIINSLDAKHIIGFGRMLNNYELNLKLNYLLKDVNLSDKQKKI